MTYIVYRLCDVTCKLYRVWQHIACMGVDKNNIPDNYLCELCNPRLVDKRRAIRLQTQKKESHGGYYYYYYYYYHAFPTWSTWSTSPNHPLCWRGISWTIICISCLFSLIPLTHPLRFSLMHLLIHLNCDRCIYSPTVAIIDTFVRFAVHNNTVSGLHSINK